MERTVIIKELLRKASKYAEELERTHYVMMGEITRIAKRLKQESENVGIN